MTESIVIIGHGSPRTEANIIHIIGSMLHDELHPGCSNGCVRTAYLEFGEPSIHDAIKSCVHSGAKRVIIHPYFLNAGVHVTEDIPGIIRQAEEAYPGVEFIYTEPLGVHTKLIHVIIDRIRSAYRNGPWEIEKRSFEIISKETDLSDISPEHGPIVQRVIHATADAELGRSLRFHPDAVRTGIAAIRAGKDILTDVEMVRAGINKRLLNRFGGKAVCGIDHETDGTGLRGETRAGLGIEKVLRENGNIGIIAIGNAPTALFKAIEIIENMKDQPLVVGVPVGFVNALESKVLLSTRRFPFITNLNRKGGSAVAVAIVNAILKFAEEEK